MPHAQMYIQFAIYTPRPSCVCTEHHIGRESRNQTKVRDQERWRPRHSLLWSFWRSSATSLWSTAMPSPTPAAAASGEEDLLPECSHRLTPLPMPTPPPLENTMELEGLQPWKKTRPSWSTACRRTTARCLSRLPLTSPSRQRSRA
ncbi:hypothetical protein VPH35_106867 [Triticum aestivum]